MSATSEQAVPLTQAQADRILEYAKGKKMYDSELESREPAARIDDAATLVNHARNALAAGNKRDEVTEILFMAEVETGTVSAPATAPPASLTAAPAESVAPQPPAPPAPPAAPTAAPEPPSVSQTPAQTNGDASSFSDTPDDQLAEALRVLQGFPTSPTIEAEVQRIQAEQQRRASAQPAPQAPVPPSPPASPTPPVQSVPTPEPPAPPVSPTLPPVPGRPNPSVISPGGPPTPPGVPGSDIVTPPAQEVGVDRNALMAQVTVPMMQAHGLTLETMSTLTDAQLSDVVANPNGSPATPAVSQAPPANAVDPERDKLEEQVTGPMLKAWKHGRVDVPKMGLNELRLMVENPQGISDPSLLEQARAADGQTGLVPVASEQPAAPPEAPVVEPPAPSSPPAAEAPQPPQAVPQTPAPEPIRPPLPDSPIAPVSSSSGVQDAMAIIAREHLPVPPDIEEPYHLPNDVSKVSDNELRSLHARAHAVEARVNWLISERQDEVGDLERLRDARKVYVRNNLPPKAEGDTGRRTKDAIEAIVEGDEEAQQYQAQISEIEKGTNKLKVIRDNAHRDCERMSRQWSMRYKEEDKSPTR